MIPVKATSSAKSRLAVPTALRPALASAFACDTVAAAVACARVLRVVVVTDDTVLGAGLQALGAEVLRRTLPLNRAVSEAAGRVPGPVAALPADLPALTAHDLSEALATAERHPRTVASDRQGVGTVLLTAASGPELRPAFGPGSFLAHRSGGAVPLDEGSWPRLRCDVDTVADLEEAARLGVGVATDALLRGGSLPGVQATVSTYDPSTRCGSVLLDDGVELPFDSAAVDAGEMRFLRFGQRVRIRTAGDDADLRVTSVILATLADPS